jgi:hypothetical protein
MKKRPNPAAPGNGAVNEITPLHVAMTLLFHIESRASEF